MKKLSAEKFACEADAVKALSKISKEFKYHQIEQSEVTKFTSNNQNNEPEICYQISATVCKNENQINKENLSAGRFILATTHIPHPKLFQREITEMKNQS